MNAAKLSDGLLPADQTIALLERIAQSVAPSDSTEVLRDLAASTAISWSRARNTIHKLVSYGFVEQGEGGKLRTRSRHESEWRNLIANEVVLELEQLLTERSAWSSLRYERSTGSILIDAMALPNTPDGMSVWIIEFGVAHREKVQDRHWGVSDSHISRLLDSAKNSNSHLRRQSKSAQRLAAELALQAEHGEEAEKWVLAFEKQRLDGHPLREQVRQISQDDVTAGFDILSFANEHSLQHDLFIEVKSHGRRKAFHWSRNEIATAEEFGDSYALYLVDRRKIENPEYTPQIILGPTAALFKQEGSGWVVEPTSYEHLWKGADE